MVGPYSRVIHKLFTYTSAVEVSFGLAALTSSSHAHTHTVHTHTHTNKISLCSKMVICARTSTRFSQIFPAYPPQTLAAFHYRFLSSTALSIDKKKIIGLKLSFKHFVTKNAFFAWKSTFQGGCLFRMKGHKCSECRIPSPQSPC